MLARTGVVRGPDKWHGRAAGDPCAERPHHGSGLHSAGTDPAQLAGGRATVINPRRASIGLPSSGLASLG